MAKSIQGFFGRDTHGNFIEVVQRVDGVWFERHQEAKGRYGVGYSKWAMHSAPEFITKERSIYAEDYSLENEYISLPEGEFINWGFNKLKKIDGDLSFRLPN